MPLPGLAAVPVLPYFRGICKVVFDLNLPATLYLGGIMAFMNHFAVKCDIRNFSGQ